MHSIFGFSAGGSSVPQSTSRVADSIISTTQAMFKYHRDNICFSKAKAECPSYPRSVSKANVSQVKTISAGMGPGPLSNQGGKSLPRKRGRAITC